MSVAAYVTAPSVAERFHAAAAPTRLDDAMARRYSARIRRHALRIARKLPHQDVLTDLMSAGFTGLVDACRRLDDEREHSVEAYVDHRIRGAMLDELRGRDPLSRDQRAFARKLAATTQHLAQRRGHAPAESDVAAAMKITVSTLREQQARVTESAMRDAASTAEQDLYTAPGDDTDRPDARFEQHERASRVGRAIDALPERQRMALQMYYFEDMTLREIAGVLGVTESRVSQIHGEALARLRGMLTEM